MKVNEKIAALRALMREKKISAYIVPGTDPHASEYMASHWMETQWLSGFKGESATVVVTEDKALLWTDSRYYLQANIELKGTGIILMRESDIDCPSVPQWLADHVSGQIGVNPEMYSVNSFAALQSELDEAGIGVVSVDLIRPLWIEDRPAIPQYKLYVYDEKFAGESVSSKLTRIRKAMAAKKATAMIISALDEIVWLLNIRGKDVEYTPVVISYVVLEQDKTTLFILPEKVDQESCTYFANNHINIANYEDVFDYIHQLKGAVLYDGAKVNEALYEAIADGVRRINAQSPILVDKSHKNAVELEGERLAMAEDAIALTRFFRWLYEDAFSHGQKQTEWTLMEKLHEYRLLGKNFTDESFGTIAGYKGNGAIVHYAATADNCADVLPEGMLLLDSGGQYLDGTTDITRTVWLGGNIPEQAKRDYTYVLKGHIALQTARFPRGTRGNQLDALAKQYMWQDAITFGHGTGHGVGHFCGCHEGPQNVRTDMNPTSLEPGQIISDEPGIYRTNQWGIRIENLITVRETTDKAVLATRATEDTFYEFETLTLCYYDRQLMDMSLLNKQEIAWLNAYHKRVYDTIADRLDAKDRAFLAEMCKPIAL